MTLRYLLDTNVISEPLRLQPDPNTLARLHQNQRTIAIAALAATHQLTLVTFNRADYVDFSGLSLEDWRT